MSQGDIPQSRESRHACRDELGLGYKQKKFFKKQLIFFLIFFANFFWPRTLALARLSLSSHESLIVTGSATCEIITDQPGQSTVLSYQSLARYCSIGFDNLKSPKGIKFHRLRPNLAIETATRGLLYKIFRLNGFFF